MRAIRCPCGHTLTAGDNDALLTAARKHAADGECLDDAPFAQLTADEQVEVVDARSYATA